MTIELIITDQAFRSLEAVAIGMSPEQAAYTLGIEPWEVNYHIQACLYRINVARTQGLPIKRVSTQKVAHDPE